MQLFRLQPLRERGNGAWSPHGAPIDVTGRAVAADGGWRIFVEGGAAGLQDPRLAADAAHVSLAARDYRYRVVREGSDSREWVIALLPSPG